MPNFPIMARTVLMMDSSRGEVKEGQCTTSDRLKTLRQQERCSLMLDSLFALY